MMMKKKKLIFNDTDDDDYDKEKELDNCQRQEIIIQLTINH